MDGPPASSGHQRRTAGAGGPDPSSQATQRDEGERPTNGWGDTATAERRRQLVRDRWAVPAWLEVAGRWSWHLLPLGVVAYVVVRFLATIRFVVLPLLVALMAAALLAPLQTRLRRRMPGGAAAAVVVLVSILTSVGVMSLTGFLVASTLTDAEQWQATGDEVRRWLRDGPIGLTTEEIADLERRSERWLTTGLGEVSADRALLLSRSVGGIILTLLLLFFFLKDGGALWRWVTDRVRPERRPSVHRAGEAAFGALGGYIRGVALTGLIDALLIGIGLQLLGVPLVIPLTVLTFVAAFFPIVGAAAAGALAALVALVSNGPTTALAVVVLAVAVQQIEGNVMMPLILRRRVSLHPVVILTALAVGGGLGGISGAFVAVPAAAMVIAAVAAMRRVGERQAAAQVPPTDRATGQRRPTVDGTPP